MTASSLRGICAEPIKTKIQDTSAVQLWDEQSIPKGQQLPLRETKPALNLPKTKLRRAQALHQVILSQMSPILVFINSYFTFEHFNLHLPNAFQ